MNARRIAGMAMAAWLALMPVMSVLGILYVRMQAFAINHPSRITEVCWVQQWGHLPEKGDDIELGGMMFDVLAVTRDSGRWTILLAEDRLEAAFASVFQGGIPSEHEEKVVQPDWPDKWMPVPVMGTKLCFAEIRHFFPPDCSSRAHHCPDADIWQPPES